MESQLHYCLADWKYPGHVLEGIVSKKFVHEQKQFIPLFRKPIYETKVSVHNSHITNVYLELISIGMILGLQIKNHSTTALPLVTSFGH